MKVEGIVFTIIGVFLGVCGLVYWFMSGDPTGTTALAITFAFGMLIDRFLSLVHGRVIRLLDGRSAARHASPRGTGHSDSLL